MHVFMHVDHMVISTPHVHLVSSMRVQRRWDLADHWPIRAEIEGRPDPLAAPAGEAREVFSGLPYRPGRERAADCAEQTQQWRDIQWHNHWGPLRALMEADELEYQEAVLVSWWLRCLSSISL